MDLGGGLGVPERPGQPELDLEAVEEARPDVLVDERVVRDVVHEGIVLGLTGQLAVSQ